MVMYLAHTIIGTPARRVALASLIVALACLPQANAQDEAMTRGPDTPQVFQPQPFAATGTTVTVPRSRVEAKEGTGRGFVILRSNKDLQELVNDLNKLGTGPRDTISILQGIRRSGALQAQPR